MKKRTLSILLIDASESEYELTRKELYQNPADDRYDFALDWRNSLAAGLTAIAQNTYDAVLLEFNLPDVQGIEGFLRIQSVAPDVPVVILTGADDEKLALKVVELGAQDYLVKGKHTELLARAVIYAVHRQGALQRLEQSERRTRAAALAKSAFFANMSHEIRNPLTSIIGFSEALMGVSLGKKEQQRALSSIFANGQHLLKLISDILDFSKIEAGELKIEISAENLSTFLRELKQVFTQSAAKKNLEFTIEFEPPTPVRLETDFFRLRQILYNLLGNAIKFTKEGFVKLTIRTNPDDKTMEFEVRDSGVGISDKAKEQLFRSFSQGESGRAKEFGGTGLGLVISRELAERMGGSITFKSRQGIGSVFAVTLPLGETGMQSLSSEPPTLDEGALSQEMGDLKVKGRVLVADDVEDNRDLISLLLGKIGVEVETAKDGAQALEKASRESFDLILLDMEMPLLSGHEVAKSLRSKGSLTPIVAITAMMLEDSLNECLAAGCDACLPKPFSQQELYSCILKFMGKERAPETKEAEPHPSVQNSELEKVRRNFVRKLSSRIEEIEAALDSKDLSRLKSEAHRLIGAGLFGFQELSHFGGTLESLIIQEQVGGLGLVEALVKKVRGEVNRIMLTNGQEKGGAQASQERAAQTATVLVLDGDDVNLKAVCRVLNVKGFIAAPARSEEEALALTENGNISLFLIALETAKNEEYEVISAVRKNLKRNIPVIAMTSRLPSEVRNKLSEVSVQQLLIKPISRDQLLSTIDQLITANLSSEEPRLELHRPSST